MARRAVGPVPRAWLDDREARDEDKDGRRKSPFGQADQPKWKVPTSDNSSDWADLRAAMVQHRFSQLIRQAIIRKPTSVETVAAQMSMTPDGLRRILNGSAHVTLTDLSRIAGAVDREIQLTLHRLPPTEKAEATKTTERKAQGDKQENGNGNASAAGED